MSRTDANALIALDPVDLTVTRKFNYTSILPEAKVSTLPISTPHAQSLIVRQLWVLVRCLARLSYVVDELFVSSHCLCDDHANLSSFSVLFLFVLRLTSTRVIVTRNISTLFLCDNRLSVVYMTGFWQLHQGIATDAGCSCFAGHAVWWPLQCYCLFLLTGLVQSNYQYTKCMTGINITMHTHAGHNICVACRERRASWLDV